MREHHVALLACSGCGADLSIASRDRVAGDRIIDGHLRCHGCGATFPVAAGVPRFVPRENYASGFGLEWTRHARTQYDSHSGLPVSRQRFFGSTHWPIHLDGERILEIGSGSGRFTEQAAETGATVVSVDYSYAVDANYASNGHLENVLIVQADVFALPLRPQTFDRLFCLGMLQHTPDPERAFMALPPMLRPGGWICADLYKATFWRTVMQTKYYVRPFTRRMDPEKLYNRVTAWVDFMWPLARRIRQLPKGYAINWRLLVADYSFLDLTEQQLKEWAYLDTFDMLAPRYDYPQRYGTLQKWLDRAGLNEGEVEYTPHGLVMRGRAPGARPVAARA
jgi:SAM-dependent methyltransferase